MPAASWVGELLRGWANQIAARYGHPVYLVGSALELDEPRDVDVVVILPEDEFENRYGPWREVLRIGSRPSPGGERWAADVGKISRQVAQLHRGVNVDFKVESEAWAGAMCAGRARLRIDSVPLEGDPGAPTGPGQGR